MSSLSRRADATHAVYGPPAYTARTMPAAAIGACVEDALAQRGMLMRLTHRETRVSTAMIHRFDAVDVLTGAADSLVVKCCLRYADVDEGQVEFDAITEFAAAYPLAGVRCPDVIAFVEAHSLLVTRFIDRLELSRWLGAHAGTPGARSTLESICQQAGTWLAQFHRPSREVIGVPPRLRLLAMRLAEHVDASAARGGMGGVLRPSEAARVRHAITRALSLAESTPIELVRRHGDFGPGNLLVDPRTGAVTVIDLAQSAWWSRWDDVWRFLTTLQAALRSRPTWWGAFDGARAAFLEGYGRKPTDADPLCTLASMVSLLGVVEHAQSAAQWLPPAMGALFAAAARRFAWPPLTRAIAAVEQHDPLPWRVSGRSVSLRD